ncbi:hypothetical protein [Citromicrobium bathyomarinum]|uniref:hypothetical protein n=1 Tax=Citromicrobium bathyomarinum TaxID=72174 RepID=UPI00315A7488
MKVGILSQKKSIEAEFATFIDEWMNTIITVRDAVSNRDFSSAAHDTVVLQPLKKANYVNREGYAILESVASRLLCEAGMALKVGQDTAQKLLLECFNEDLEKRKWASASENAIIAKARKRLKEIELPDGSYIFASQFSYSAKGLKFDIGPVSIISKARFYRENAKKLRKPWEPSESSKDVHKFLLKKWIEHMRNFDHVISVNVGHSERELAWEIARETAEFALNIVRTFFGYYHTHRIRLSGDFTLEQNRASVIIEQNDVWLSHGTVGVSSFLDDDAIQHFEWELEPMSPLFASFADWLASGKHDGTPTVERLRYANRLIAEAYCEPSDYLRLVRLISAFEALAIIRSHEKVHNLAVRCANVGSWGRSATACEIYDNVRSAYHVRNMVVHGDAPTTDQVRKAFFGLEKHTFGILVGFLSFYAGIERTAAPRSIRTLAREIENRIEFFFYDPSFGFD